jgi:hypothetical protein
VHRIRKLGLKIMRMGLEEVRTEDDETRREQGLGGDALVDWLVRLGWLIDLSLSTP